MSHSHTRIAISDIELCKKDGRKRYGLESVGNIKAGQKFEFTPGDYEKLHAAYVCLGKGASGYVTRSVAQAIEASSFAKVADSFADVACELACPTSMAGEVIDKLLQAGKLSIDDIRASIKALMAED